MNTSRTEVVSELARSTGASRTAQTPSHRVCVLVPAHWSAAMGGSEYQASLLVEHLAERYESEVHYLTTANDPAHRPKGYRLVRFSTRAGIRRFGMFFDALLLYRALRRLRPDVIYQQVGCAHTGIAAWYAKRHGCRLVWRVASDRDVTPAPIRWWRLHHRLERRLLDYGIRHADVIVAQTEGQRAHLAALHGRSDAVVVPNFHRDDPVGARQSIGPKRVLWIANVKRLKNPLAFVRLAERFRARSDVEFVAVGSIQEPEVGAELMEAIRGLANFRYLGARPQAECNALLARACVLVNTSDYEGFPNTFVQAWLRRVPVVSLKVDPDGVLSRNGLGLLAGDEDQLYRDVARLLDEPALVARIGERCRVHALERHSMANADRVAALLGLRRRAGVDAPIAAGQPAPRSETFSSERVSVHADRVPP